MTAREQPMPAWNAPASCMAQDRQFDVVIEEAVLRYQVGNAEVMAGQLGHLLSVISMPWVSVGVIPFTVRERPMWTVEGFVMFDAVRVDAELLSARVTVTPAARDRHLQPGVLGAVCDGRPRAGGAGADHQRHRRCSAEVACKFDDPAQEKLQAESGKIASEIIRTVLRRETLRLREAHDEAAVLIVIFAPVALCACFRHLVSLRRRGAPGRSRSTDPVWPNNW